MPTRYPDLMPHRDNGVAAERWLEYLIACLPEQETMLAERASVVEHWPALLQSALHHGLEDYLFRRLVRAGVGLPEAVLTRFRLIQAHKAAWTLQLTAQTDRVFDTLSAVNIPAAILKGPVLGERLYGGDGLRSSSDLDVLIPYGQVQPALAALASLGYQADATTVARALAGDHNIALDNVLPPLELHFHLFRRFGVTLRADDFLARAIPYQTQHGQVVSVLAPEDEFLFLCVHAAAHSFARLAWLFDLKLLLHKYPTFDWDGLLRRAQEWRVTTSVIFACELLRQRLEVETPLLTSLTAGQRRWLGVNQRLFDRAMTLYNRPRQAFGAKLGFFVASNLYQSSLHDRWRSRVRFLARVALRTLQGRGLSPGET
ncbi:MAG: nucleotidyltransferase family protein [Chloracidobacterium sp.]